MKRQVLLIGIGAGNPEFMTAQAIDALNRAAVFFIPHKGDEKQDLARLRTDVCERFIPNYNYRLVDFDVPVRGTCGPTYRENVDRWHNAVADVYEHLLREELKDGELGAFLIWGDPSLYDSTMRVLDRVRSRGQIGLEYDVIPGISAIQALTAAHKIPLNRIGESVLISTGRKLAEGFPADADSVVVMLDGDCAFKRLDPEAEIYWGAYLGTEDEILISGRLGDVAGEIERMRAEARARKGWIMDTYLLRKPGTP
jgi:precorrin-6A synthase